MSVLVVGAVGAAVAVSLLLLGLGSSRTSYAHQESSQARALADACVEEALERVRSDQSFAGSGALALGAGSCTYTVTIQGGENRTIASAGTVGTIIRKVEILIDALNPQIGIASWQEVADSSP